jgi:tRNA-specific 2-thiouridylase
VFSICEQLDIPLHIENFSKKYWDHVFAHFLAEYQAGRTPNPDILCNKEIKFKAFLNHALELGADKIATGHYARVRKEGQRYVVSAGLDVQKDQSYVLWGLSQSALAKTLFPIGGFKKTEIRELASKAGFERLSKKAESYEICFIPDNDYRGFLQRKKPEETNRMQNGQFVDKSGKILGTHSGYPFFTVGQRKGLGIALGEPAFVTGIRPETNEVVLGSREDLLQQTMFVRNLNLLKYEQIQEGQQAVVKIRYKDRGTLATLYPGPELLEVVFEHPVEAIAPGQSAVMYEGEDVIGGGFIARNPNQTAV